MAKKEKKSHRKRFVIVIVLLFILATVLIVSLATTTPRWYRRKAVVLALQGYLKNNPETQIRDLSELPYSFVKRRVVKSSPEARPTREKDVIVLNSDCKKDSRDWVVLVKGGDIESWCRGSWVLWNNGQITRTNKTQYLIRNRSDLKYYYCVPYDPNNI